MLKCKEKEIISTSHPKRGRSARCQARVRDPPGCYQGCWRRGSPSCQSRLSHLPTHVCFTPAPWRKPRGKVPDTIQFWNENEIPCFPLPATAVQTSSDRWHFRRYCSHLWPSDRLEIVPSKITVYLYCHKGGRVKFLQTVKTMDGRKRHSFFFNLYYGWARSTLLLAGSL